MLQQTTVSTVKPYFSKFLAKWPSISSLAMAERDDIMAQWAGLGYYSRARNLHAAARQIVHEHGGSFPASESQLKSLQGVGDYTAAAIAAIAFDQPAVVIDGNVDRVIVRHENLNQPIADIRPAIKAHATARTPQHRPGDYAQAMMDLGATICTRAAPQCLLCPVRDDCKALALAEPAALPVKKIKPPKPLRRGGALVLRDGKAVLLVRNPPQGLLGGMLGFPVSDWIEVPKQAGNAKASFDDWQDFLAAHPVANAPGCGELGGLGTLSGLGPYLIHGEVRHTFTHFHLVLRVISVDVPYGWRPLSNQQAAFYPSQGVDSLGLPTLMKKVWQMVSHLPPTSGSAKNL